MTIQAIVFDMDDTLYRERDYVISGFKAVGAWMEGKYGVVHFYETALKVMLSGEKKVVFNKTLENLGIEPDESLIQEIVEQYRNHDPDIHLLDDAKWVLNSLNPTYKIGMISDGFFVTQEKKVDALRLKEKIRAIILTDQWGRENWKPSQLPYKRASKELGVAHQQCVYIGDNVTKDFIAAKELGWTTVHIDRKEGVYANLPAEEKYHAHYRINDLRELSNLPVLKHLFLKQFESTILC